MQYIELRTLNTKNVKQTLARVAHGFDILFFTVWWWYAHAVLEHSAMGKGQRLTEDSKEVELIFVDDFSSSNGP